MTIREIAGAIMLAVPFIALFALILSRDGWRVAIGVTAATGALGAWLWAAGMLLGS